MSPQEFGNASELLRRVTVQVRGPGSSAGSGSGVVWSADGLLVTNAHVTRGDHAAVELWDGRRLEAAVTARDPRRDLAALRVPAGDLPAATPRDSDTLRPGELVIAVGNPLGFIGALTTGVVHAVGPLPAIGPQSWVQAGVRLAPGNSGGPLADATGRIVGINTMIAGGLALAVPSNAVCRFLRQGASGPYLGVTVRPIPLRVDGRRTLGLLVLEITPGSPAQTASLFVGDVLLAAQDRTFRSPDDLSRAIAAGGLVRVRFLRGKSTVLREVAVRLGTSRAEAA
ncbi:MAG TPA: trypsin-like peptidase domain-containing protein [Bryobacteraceae bacterium]|nr:trypsin-like peptidase domain-containing protein [Bryobacteraceae bacterium]